MIKNKTILEYFSFAVIFCLLILLFALPMNDLFTEWNINPDYSHGYFVIPISLYMIWIKRDLLKNANNKPSLFGFMIFLLSIILFSFALMAKFHTMIYATMILVLITLSISIAGWKKSKYFLIPILFLFFMFPIPSSIYIMITNPLKLFITTISSSIIRLFNITVFQEGNLLFFTNTQLEVAEACSGIRSLYSYMMLGIVFSISCKSTLTKITLIFSSFPIAIFVNIVRVTLTGILSHYFGEKVAQGFFHESAGLVLFIAGLILMFSLYYLIEGRYKTN